MIQPIQINDLSKFFSEIMKLSTCIYIKKQCKLILHFLNNSQRDIVHKEPLFFDSLQ
jgi:hypothetical protein